MGHLADGSVHRRGGAFVDFLSSQLWSGLVEMLVAVSVETILNVVWAGLWPLSWLQHYSIVVAAGAVLLTYAAYRVARRRFPSFDAFMQQVDVSGEADQPAPADSPTEPEGKAALRTRSAARRR